LLQHVHRARDARLIRIERGLDAARHRCERRFVKHAINALEHAGERIGVVDVGHRRAMRGVPAPGEQLIVAPFTPWPADFGGAIRMLEIVKHLASKGPTILLAPAVTPIWAAPSK